MSIKFKLPFFILSMLIINILLLGGYYQFFLSDQISEDNNKIQQELQTETDSIALTLKGRPDITQQLKNIADSQHLMIEVQDETGTTLFSEGNEVNSNLNHRASSLLVYDGKVCLLRVTRPMKLTKIALSAFDSTRSLLKVEVAILCFIMLLSGILIYFGYARPILSLRRKMDLYQSGIRPERVSRLDEIGDLQNRFADLTDVIEEEKQKQNRMIASISHDIKTPLTSVMGYAERLKKNSLTPEKHDRYVDTIYQKSVVIKSLIEEFDEYLSYHMQGSLKRQAVTAGQLCTVLKLDYEEELSERGIAFSIRDDCPQENLWIDLSRIRRVFGNLIDNSLKSLSDRPPHISVSCEQKEGGVLFFTEDNGTGVPDGEELKKIFDPFYTSDHARSVAGLGLSICREIIEAHGGHIWAENIASGGLRIGISLPAEKSSPGGE